ncbi:MAG: type II toxin-antitoxin system YafQ family toxin [Selenomonadaceae bacterium]|nr:type II toxin-antitoxin system YafQ family toxin [Selenomonadaceae bacterium]
MKKRNYNMMLLENVVDTLLAGIPLPEKNKDHPLQGDWKGYRECHIEPDWLLIYRIYEDLLVLTLVRTGTHSDLNFE